MQPQKPAPCRPSPVDRRFSRVRFPVNVGLRSALRTQPLGHRVQADAGLESGPTEASRAGSAAGPASGPRSGQALPTYRALQQAAGADRAAPPHIYGSQCRSSSTSTSSTAGGTTSTRSREPLVGRGGRGQRRRESHAGGLSPTTRRRRREAAEHCVNGLTREVHMPMAPTWVSRAVRRPSLADSARATAQQCRHGQVFLHTSAAGCALAPQERLEAGIPNVLNSTVAFLSDGILPLRASKLKMGLYSGVQHAVGQDGTTHTSHREVRVLRRSHKRCVGLGSGGSPPFTPPPIWAQRAALVWGCRRHLSTS